MARKPAQNESSEIMELKTDRITVRIVGKTPLIYNRMTEKAKRELLMPRGQKSAAEKAMTMKHNPLKEYQDSAHAYLNDSQPTRFYAPAAWFKNAMMTAALDIPTTKKAAIGRMLWISSDKIPIWGIPQLHMCGVITAGANHTPDIRTRAILPEWCCEVSCQFVLGKISTPSVLNLFAAAGIFSGVGDFRQEKGKGNYGQWNLVGENDEDFKRITEKQGREMQDLGLETPDFYDIDTQELFTWYETEYKSRYGEKSP